MTCRSEEFLTITDTEGRIQSVRKDKVTKVVDLGDARRIDTDGLGYFVTRSSSEDIMEAMA